MPSVEDRGNDNNGFRDVIFYRSYDLALTLKTPIADAIDKPLV